MIDISLKIISDLLQFLLSDFTLVNQNIFEEAYALDDPFPKKDWGLVPNIVSSESLIDRIPLNRRLSSNSAKWRNDLLFCTHVLIILIFMYEYTLQTMLISDSS